MSRIWRALTRNLLLRFSALVCAAVLWVYVSFSLSATRTITVVVRVDTPPSQSVGLSGPNGTLWPSWYGVPVRLTVSGPSRIVSDLHPSDFHPRIRLGHDAPSAGGIVTLDEDIFALPDSVRLLRIEPSEISVTVREKGKTGGP